jgi:hypothetical protein
MTHWPLYVAFRGYLEFSKLVSNTMPKFPGKSEKTAKAK